MTLEHRAVAGEGRAVAHGGGARGGTDGRPASGPEKREARAWRPGRAVGRRIRTGSAGRPDSSAPPAGAPLLPASTPPAVGGGGRRRLGRGARLFRSVANRPGRAALPWLALAAVLLTPLTAYPHLNHSGNLDCPETLEEGETGRITLNFSSNGDHFLFSHGNVFGARFENSNRTAVRPGDYTVDTGGKVGGSGKKRVGTDAVTVQDDLLEGPETFTVSAYQVDRGNPSYVDGVRTFSCTITILDDETLVVTGVRVSSNPQRGDTYRRGETIEVSVTFSHEVEVRGNPLLSLFLGTSRAWRGARYAAGSGSKVLKFRYTVQPTDRDTDGITIPASDPGGTTSGLGGGEILDNRQKRLEADRSYARAGNLSGHKVDGRATVEEVRISSGPLIGDTYRRGETIEVSVEFNEAVEVEGTPVLSLGVGAWRGARYAEGSGSTVLKFRYTVNRRTAIRTGSPSTPAPSPGSPARPGRQRQQDPGRGNLRGGGSELCAREGPVRAQGGWPGDGGRGPARVESIGWGHLPPGRDDRARGEVQRSGHGTRRSGARYRPGAAATSARRSGSRSSSAAAARTRSGSSIRSRVKTRTRTGSPSSAAPNRPRTASSGMRPS